MRQFPYHFLARWTSLAVASFLFGQGFAQSSEWTEAKKAYDAKEFSKAAQLYLSIVKKNPEAVETWYNAACSLALAGDKDQSFKTLDRAVDHGYHNIDQIVKDLDLVSLKSDPRWPQLIAKVEAKSKLYPKRMSWKKPFVILPVPATTDGFADKLSSSEDTVWLESDVLTFLRRSKAPTVALTGGIQEKMSKIGESDLWILQLKMAGWENCFASYDFVEPGKTTYTQRLWSGDKAKHTQKTSTLMGTIVTKQFKSKALGLERGISIYLPPNAPKKDLPAFFLADGACKEFALVLEPLILAGKVRPCAIVGIQSGKYAGKPSEPYDMMLDVRAKDYLEVVDPSWFAKHLTMFTVEIPEYVAKEYGISRKREDKAVGGFSNGGAFTAAVAVRCPERFGAALPLSLGIPPGGSKPKAKMPRMFFMAGNLESFIINTTYFYDQVKIWGVDAELHINNAGHDLESWILAFEMFAPKVFPVQK